MFTRNELLDSIEELERSPKTFQNIQKLATFYSIYDHLYGYSYSSAPAKESVKEVIIGKHGDSEFLQIIEGKEADKVYSVLDELMETIQALQPRLYEATLQQLRDMLI